MRISPSIAQTNRSQFNLKNHSGFSLIEILVAMFLVVLVYSSMSIGTDTSTQARNKLDSAIDIIERGIRFASNESILRGSIVRMKFNLDEEQVSYRVEYGPKTGFVLPDFEKVPEPTDLDEKERVEWEKKVKNVDKNFVAVEDLDREYTIIPEGVIVLGLASNLKPDLIQDGTPAFYFYPSGEKDDVIIMLANYEEVAALAISPYSDEITKQFRPIRLSDDTIDEEEAIETAQKNLSKELFEDWQTKEE